MTFGSSLYQATFGLMFLIFFSASHAASSSTTEGIEAFVEGRDYRSVTAKGLDAADDLSELERIVDIEVFYWYGCEPCYQVEQALKDYLREHPEVSQTRTPLVAHIDWRQQAYLQPLLDQLSAQIEVPEPLEIYQACLADCEVFADFESSKQWVTQQLSLENLPYINESLIWQAEKNYRKRADSFSISQVPTIIIRESYLVDANSAGSVERFIQIIDYLLTQKNN